MPTIKARILTRFPGPVGPPGAPGPDATESLFTTRSAVASATITSTPQFLRTSGYAVIGDGGHALYKRVGSQPAHAGKVQSTDGAWWEIADQEINVRMFGAKGDGSTNDSAAFTNANAYLVQYQNSRGSTCHIPGGTYILSTGFTITVGEFKGAGLSEVILSAGTADTTVVTLSGSHTKLQGVWVYGGGSGATGSATTPAVVVSGGNCVVRDTRIWFGSYCLNPSGSDCKYYNVSLGFPYSDHVALTSGSDGYINCSFNHVGAGYTITNSRPFSNRANTTAYTQGQVVVHIASGKLIQCTVAGTTSGTAPTIKNYGVAMVDGTVTWGLYGHASLVGLGFNGGAGENTFTNCDLTGDGYLYSVQVDAAAARLKFDNCIPSRDVNLLTGTYVSFRGCHFGAGAFTVPASYTGMFHIDGCHTVTATTVTVGAGVSYFAITNNIFAPVGGSTITVTAGASDHYDITGNLNVTVTDNGTGQHKNVRVEKASQVVNGTFALATGSTAFNVTGFGFNPKSVAIHYSINGGSCGGVGYASVDGTQGTSSTATDATSWFHSSLAAMFVSNAAASNSQTFVVSFIVDGIRITNTQVGAPGGSLRYCIIGHQ